jgi:hypothetical protein
MTRKLEEILNLPSSKEITKQEEKKKPVKAGPINFRSMSDFDKISAALPPVTGLGDLSDTEFDELAEKAANAYEDLMDLGMNVEARYSARLFEVASTMLKNAIDAKSAKIDKKLKMIELQLKKQKLDNDTSSEDNGITIQGDGFMVTDRNSLIEKLKNMK